MFPWRDIATTVTNAGGILGVRFEVNPASATSGVFGAYYPAILGRWFIDHEDDSGTKQCIKFNSYANQMDTSRHSLCFTFDGTTGTVYIDGNVILTANITQDTSAALGALGTKTIKAFGVGDFGYRDTMFNRGFPPYEYGSAGRAFYGYQDRVAVWVGTCLTPTQVTAIADDMLGTTTHPLAGALKAPTTTSGLTLLHWLDAAYGSKLVEKGTIATYATADGDKVGSWRSRIGNTPATFNTSTDAKRPALKLNIQNGLPVVRSDGNTNSQLMSYSGALSQPYTLFFVAARQTGSAEGYFWGHDSGAGYFGFSNSTTANLYMGAMLGLAEDSADDVVMQAIHALKNPPAPPAPAPAPAPPPAAVAQAALMSIGANQITTANQGSLAEQKASAKRRGRKTNAPDQANPSDHRSDPPKSLEAKVALKNEVTRRTSEKRMSALVSLSRERNVLKANMPGRTHQVRASGRKTKQKATLKDP
jgi:hypothetical protein